MRRVSVTALLILVVNVIFSTATRAEDVEITRLEMRDRIVTITADPDGMKYSVFTPDGSMLDAKLSEDQLSQKHPDIYEKMRPAVANKATPDIIPWAGM